MTNDGKIPFTLRIGVTGHRQLVNPDAVAAAVRTAVHLIRDQVAVDDNTRLALVAVSALAEGADRLVASEVLTKQGGRLEVVLPCRRTRYAQDFKSATSRKDFHGLMAVASHVTEAPTLPTRKEGYEWAGRRVVERCDVLIAIWDGEPGRGRGGTQEIVTYARDRQVPVAWIRPASDGDPVLSLELTGKAMTALKASARDFRRYNARRLPESQFDALATRQIGSLGLPDADDPTRDPVPTAGEQVAAWLVPFFVRADLQALQLHRRIRALGIGTFAMAATAVTVVAVQVNFWPGANWVASFEVLILLLLLAIPIIRRRLRLHERWHRYRFLAERLRSAYFLALAGTPDRRPNADAIVFADPAVAWIERALTEIMEIRPRPPIAETAIATLRDYLARYWIDDQVAYHLNATNRHDRTDRMLRRFTATLFTITLISAVLHLIGIGRHDPHSATVAATVIVLSICAPAAGAAIHGVETQGEYRRHSERFSRMTTLLGQVRQRMDDARDLTEIRAAAADVERIMRKEEQRLVGSHALPRHRTNNLAARRKPCARSARPESVT